jgi:type IV secretion system protein VirD4
MTTAQHLYPPFIVGKYKGEYLKYYGQDFLMTAAGTRSGKGTSLAIPNLLTYGFARSAAEQFHSLVV